MEWGPGPSLDGAGSKVPVGHLRRGDHEAENRRSDPGLSQPLSPMQACSRGWPSWWPEGARPPQLTRRGRSVSSAVAPAHPPCPGGLGQPHGSGGPGPACVQALRVSEGAGDPGPASPGPTPAAFPLSHSKNCPMLPQVRHPGRGLAARCPGCGGSPPTPPSCLSEEKCSRRLSCTSKLFQPLPTSFPLQSHVRLLRLLQQRCAPGHRGRPFPPAAASRCGCAQHAVIPSRRWRRTE